MFKNLAQFRKDYDLKGLNEENILERIGQEIQRRKQITANKEENRKRIQNLYTPKLKSLFDQKCFFKLQPSIQGDTIMFLFL